MQNLFSYLCLTSLFLLPWPALGQITPDRSLGSESSLIFPDNINGIPSDKISGGAIRGTNLFHSFQEFNINEGRGAYFTNPQNITNIFTRVTGNNSTKIFGRLGVLGNANLFLLNPKGIMFGPNAQLDLGGSFIATSADSVIFDQGFAFSASNPEIPLLTVNIPVGLNFRENSGAIINQSQSLSRLNLPLPQLPNNFPINPHVGLEVTPGQTLALIGGDIQLIGGNLTANTGQIWLGSVKSPGLVSFTPTPFGLGLDYQNIEKFGNIQLNQSLVNTSGLGGGSIQIKGGQVNLSQSGLTAIAIGNIDSRAINVNAEQLQIQNGTQISTLTLGTAQGGDINLKATESLEIVGLGIAGYQQFYSEYLKSGTLNPFDPQIAVITGTVGSGDSGDINIETKQLLIRNGVVGGTGTLGAGDAGTLNIRATTANIISSALNNGPNAGSTGQGGSINVEGEKLIVQDGSNLVSVSRGDGASGNITINTTESVELSGSLPGGTAQTVLGTSSFDGSGKSGDITINTKRLIVADGGFITLSTGAIIGQLLLSTSGGVSGNLTVKASESIEIRGESGFLGEAGYGPSALGTQTSSLNKGGDISITTPVLTLQDGGIITSGSLGVGDAGDITINADRLTIKGMGTNSQFFSRIEAATGRAYTIVNPEATGNAGSLNLHVNQLTILDGASINVQALGPGRAGNINVIANSIALDRQSSIDGTTASGEGADINLQAEKITMRRGSRISTDSGSAIGGNINLNSNILWAVPQENNDITSNARSAAGGKITVNVPNIFGLQAINREQLEANLGLNDQEFASLAVNPTFLLPSSDITAISQATGAALQGSVTFSSSGVNPSNGLISLKENVSDPATLVSINLCNLASHSEFIITGKGGLPADPSDLFTGSFTQFTWIQPTNISSQLLPMTNYQLPITQIKPAQGWTMNNRGDVTLIAQAENSTDHVRLWYPLGKCRSR